MECRQSREDFDTRRYRDDHCGGREIRSRIDVYPYRKYMMRPDDEAEESNRAHRIDHP